MQELFSYIFKVYTKSYKSDEFYERMYSLSGKISKEKESLGCHIFRDSKKENVFVLVAKWKTRSSMEKHFQGMNYKVLVGAVKVLGESYEMKSETCRLRRE